MQQTGPRGCAFAAEIAQGLQEHPQILQLLRVL